MSFFIWVMLKLIVDFDTMLIGAESEVLERKSTGSIQSFYLLQQNLSDKIRCE
jgi:hypothetical protein